MSDDEGNSVLSIPTVSENNSSSLGIELGVFNQTHTVSFILTKAGLYTVRLEHQTAPNRSSTFTVLVKPHITLLPSCSLSLASSPLPMTLVTTDTLSDSALSRLQSRGVAVSFKATLHEGRTLVVSGTELSLTFALSDDYGNPFDNISLLSIQFLQEAEDIEPDRLDILRNRDSSITAIFVISSFGNTTIFLLYNTRPLADPISFFVLPPERNGVAFHNNLTLCSRIVDPVKDDEASHLSFQSPLCGLFGTRNFQTTHFLMEVVLSFKHLVEDEEEWSLPSVGPFFMSASDPSYFYSIPSEQMLLVRSNKVSQLYQCWYDRMSTKQPPLHILMHPIHESFILTGALSARVHSGSVTCLRQYAYPDSLSEHPFFQPLHVLLFQLSFLGKRMPHSM